MFDKHLRHVFNLISADQIIVFSFSFINDFLMSLLCIKFEETYIVIDALF